jgi:hypothetical protein
MFRKSVRDGLARRDRQWTGRPTAGLPAGTSYPCRAWVAPEKDYARVHSLAPHFQCGAKLKETPFGTAHETGIHRLKLIAKALDRRLEAAATAK